LFAVSAAQINSFAVSVLKQKAGRVDRHLAEVVFHQICVELLTVLPGEVSPIVWVDEGPLRDDILRQKLGKRKKTG